MGAPCIKKLKTTYNLNMTKVPKTIIEGKYRVTRDIRVIPMVEKKEDKIQ